MGGVIGVYNSPNAAVLTQIGLFSVQHRGQESCGIASYDEKEKTFNLRRGSGLVISGLGAAALAELKGSCAIGHVRYPTSGAKSGLQDAQPFIFNTAQGDIAIALSGNIINGAALVKQIRRRGGILQHSSETELIIHLLAQENKPLEPALKDALARVEGGFGAVILSGGRLIAARDRHGIRPLVLGRLADGGYIISSETSAVEVMGGSYVRDIKPAEMLVIENGRLKSSFYAKPGKMQNCIFEQVYLSRPDSVIRGQSVANARMEMGKRLARQMKDIKADIVIPVPDSGIFAAMGFAEEAKIPFEIGLVRNHYLGRSFIKSAQSVRETAVKLKLLPIDDIINGKNIVLVDDSLVRGTTSRRLIKILREHGARKVHFAVTSPPIIAPCFYGINTPSGKELIACTHTREQIKKALGADSVYFLTAAHAQEACGGREGAQGFCSSCFTGKYIYKISKRG
ncbi:MAG: amidophosphoribosyltransferase [Elusimicrobiota bacterium]|jgi:amidophosphoribosyltransferase|nr:amidophosphoribosyltransferase [Elusimicrobiota bacterium]